MTGLAQKRPFRLGVAETALLTKINPRVLGVQRSSASAGLFPEIGFVCFPSKFASVLISLPGEVWRLESSVCAGA